MHNTKLNINYEYNKSAPFNHNFYTLFNYVI